MAQWADNCDANPTGADATVPNPRRPAAVRDLVGVARNRPTTLGDQRGLHNRPTDPIKNGIVLGDANATVQHLRCWRRSHRG